MHGYYLLLSPIWRLATRLLRWPSGQSGLVKAGQWESQGDYCSTVRRVWHKQGEVDYFYDIWSNIHYGYVGRAGGLSESVLLDGAGLEQIASDSIRKVQKWAKRKGPTRSADIEGRAGLG